MLNKYARTLVNQHRRTNPYTGFKTSHVESHKRLLNNRIRKSRKKSNKIKQKAENIKNMDRYKHPLNKQDRIMLQRKKIYYLSDANIVNNLGI